MGILTSLAVACLVVLLCLAALVALGLWRTSRARTLRLARKGAWVHVTTDPACALYDAPRPRSWLDRASRGINCARCDAARSHGRW